MTLTRCGANGVDALQGHAHRQNRRLRLGLRIDQGRGCGSVERGRSIGAVGLHVGRASAGGVGVSGSFAYPIPGYGGSLGVAPEGTILTAGTGTADMKADGSDKAAALNKAAATALADAKSQAQATALAAATALAQALATAPPPQ